MWHEANFGRNFGQIESHDLLQSDIFINPAKFPTFSSVKGQKSFKYRIAKLWNELPPDIKLCGSISVFKFNLKKELLRQFRMDQ
jgi:hypothetical protein